MIFTRLVYESLASESLTESDVLDILRKSQVRNNQDRISGLLLFSQGRFLQFIEGPPDAVHGLYARIAADTRHRELRILSETSGTQLLMPTWAMAYTSPTLEPAKADTFALKQRQALSICELLPDDIAQPFLELLACNKETA